MTYPEFLTWVEFYRAHPFDDHQRYQRPAALIATSMSGTDVNDLLAWLGNERPATTMSEADMATIKAFGMKPPRKA